MNDGERMFIEATANKDQKLFRERIRDVISNEKPLDVITEYIMNTRTKLRKTILDTIDLNIKGEELAKYYDALSEFYQIYIRAMNAMNVYRDFGDMKALSFLSFYVRYMRFFEYIPDMDDFTLNTIVALSDEYNIKELLLAGWDIIIYEVNTPLHEIFEMREITSSDVIEEVDWDGTKAKKGLEIIRRNGECGGKVFAFVYVVNNNEEKELMFHFYSVNVDGDEMRHYKYRVSRE